jgi:hypothetical protein
MLGMAACLWLGDNIVILSVVKQSQYSGKLYSLRHDPFPLSVIPYILINMTTFNILFFPIIPMYMQHDLHISRA